MEDGLHRLRFATSRLTGDRQVRIAEWLVGVLWIEPHLSWMSARRRVAKEDAVPADRRCGARFSAGRRGGSRGHRLLRATAASFRRSLATGFGRSGGASSAGGSGGGVIAASSEVTPSSLRLTMATGTRRSPSGATTFRGCSKLAVAIPRCASMRAHRRSTSGVPSKSCSDLFAHRCFASMLYIVLTIRDTGARGSISRRDGVTRRSGKVGSKTCRRIRCVDSICVMAGPDTCPALMTYSDVVSCLVLTSTTVIPKRSSHRR